MGTSKVGRRLIGHWRLFHLVVLLLSLFLLSSVARWQGTTIVAADHPSAGIMPSLASLVFAGGCMTRYVLRVRGSFAYQFLDVYGLYVVYVLCHVRVACPHTSGGLSPSG